MLMPTEFRTKPVKYSKRFTEFGCVIDEFKIYGSLEPSNSGWVQPRVPLGLDLVKCGYEFDIINQSNAKIVSINNHELQKLTNGSDIVLLPLMKRPV
jgi:hypothetical protein